MMMMMMRVCAIVQFTFSRNVTVSGRRALGKLHVISSLSTTSFVAGAYQHGQQLECVALVGGSSSVSASARLHVICNCISSVSLSPQYNLLAPRMYGIVLIGQRHDKRTTLLIRYHGTPI